MKKINIKNKKIVILGCGAVGKAVIYYLKDFFDYKFDNLYILDKNNDEKKFPAVDNAIVMGAHYINIEVTRNNVEDLLFKKLKLKEKDILIDVSTQTPTYFILNLCRKYQIFYINTSIEDDIGKDPNDNTHDNSIFMQHMNILDIVNKSKEYGNITNLIEYGMNPGLISSFSKYAIRDVAKQVLKFQIKKGKKNINTDLVKAYKTRNYNHMAKILKLRTIHCSEIDTQEPKVMEKNIKFFNTWSVLGLLDEGLDPAEIALGTHEKKIPFRESSINRVIDQLLFVDGPNYQIKFYSYVPLKIEKDGKIKFTEIEGACIHHGEGISMNRYIGSTEYAPTMHYVYKLSPITTKQLENYTVKELNNIYNGNNWKVMNVYDNKLEGYDNVGALLLFEENPFNHQKKTFGWWCGSILNTDYTKNELEDNYFGPTVIQVMAGILSGLSYAIENDNLGIIFGEDPDENYIINKIKKYLGLFYSGPVMGVKIRGHTLDALKISQTKGEFTTIDKL
jgi:homospermidine synthase